MGRLYSFLFPRKLRRAARRPFGLLAGVMFFSGWVRGSRIDGLFQSAVERASQMGYEAGVARGLPLLFCHAGKCLIPLLVYMLLTVVVVFVVCRIVIDFPAFTKAIFWSLTRAYEHYPSRKEMQRLVMLPSALCVTVLADGFVSFAAFCLSAICLNSLSKSYEMKRLNSLTRDIFRMRPHLNNMAPQLMDDGEMHDD